jgi:hypothetical protein
MKGVAKPGKLGKLAVQGLLSAPSALSARLIHIFAMHPETRLPVRLRSFTVMRGLGFGVFGQLR